MFGIKSKNKKYKKLISFLHVCMKCTVQADSGSDLAFLNQR